jgi:tetratricopeptide (TPR) repeat protein
MMSEAISPKQLEKEAKSAYQKGDFLIAARNFEAAAKGYLNQGNDLACAEMRNNASVAYLQGDEGESALRAVEGTPDTFSAEGDIKRQALALGNLGAALEELDRLDEAEQAYFQSAELLQQIGETQLRANVMQSLSALQLNMGRQLEALATMQAGVAGVERPSLKQRALKELLQMPFKFLNK